MYSPCVYFFLKRLRDENYFVICAYLIALVLASLYMHLEIFVIKRVERVFTGNSAIENLFIIIVIYYYCILCTM